MSTPSEQPFDPNDLTAYAPKWARKANEEARRQSASAANDDRPVVAFQDAVDALRDVHLRERAEDEPPADDEPAERGGFYIDNFRVPPSLDPTRSLDPSPVPNPFPRRVSRGRMSRSAILAGKVMIATGVAAFSAFLLVGKFPSQGSAGTDLPAFKQIASLGPSAPVIPEAEVRAPVPVAAPVATAPVAAAPVAETRVKPAARAPSKVQDRPRSVVAPATTSGVERTKTAALPPRPAEPDTQSAYSVQLAAHPPAVQPEMPARQTTASGKGNRIAATVATATPSKPPAVVNPVAPPPVAPPPVAAKPVAAPPVAENAAPAQPPAAKLDAEELATLMKRSEEFIGAGDFASARIVLRRAAESGHAGAALALAGTYDPAVLERFGVAGMTPDPAQAKYWYEKARELGSGEAPQLLERLASRQN